MKSALIALALASLTPAYAQDKPIALTCITEIPSTTYVVWTEGKEVLVRVIHHHGADNTPFITNNYTPSDLPRLAEMAKEVSKMGEDTTFRFPLEKCVRYGEMGFYCRGSTDVKDGVGGAKIAPWAVYTSTLVEDNLAGHYEWFTVGLMFDVNEKRDLQIEMKYPKTNCVPQRVM